jgi:hypothetical protein
MRGSITVRLVGVCFALAFGYLTIVEMTALFEMAGQTVRTAIGGG